MSGAGALWIRRACEKSRGFDPAEYPNPDDAHAAWNESCICAVIFEEFIRATQEAVEAKCLTFRYPDDGPPIGECFLLRDHEGPHLYPATGEEIDRAKAPAPQEAGEARALLRALETATGEPWCPVEAVAKARADALEEAAKIADEWYPRGNAKNKGAMVNAAVEIAAAIRAEKEK